MAHVSTHKETKFFLSDGVPGDIDAGHSSPYISLLDPLVVGVILVTTEFLVGDACFMICSCDPV